MNNQIFSKPPLSVEDQLRLLLSRGIIVNDLESAKRYLKFISYYRFCGYATEFEEKSSNLEGAKRYQNGTTFEQVLGLYIFDRKLRLLVIDAIERIEVAIRTVIANEMALQHGAHWYLQKNLFLPAFNHDALIEIIKKDTLHRAKAGSIQFQKRESFLQRYFRRYIQPELPPIWMVAEVLSLGTWSTIFSNLIDRDDQKRICGHFGVGYIVMTSWLHSLTYLRNLCAHHSMLWNRNFVVRPKTASSYRQQLGNNTHFSAQAAVLKIFLDVISPDSDWAQHLKKLLQEHPMLKVARMGFAPHWHTDSFWGTGGALTGKLQSQSAINPNKVDALTV